MESSACNRNWMIERYSRYDQDQWLPSPSGNKILLSVQGAHLLIVQNGLALESLNLLGGQKVISTEHVNRTVVVYIDHMSKMSKFRVLFQNLNDANSFIDIMKRYSRSRDSKNPVQEPLREESLSSIIEKIMKKDGLNIPSVVGSILWLSWLPRNTFISSFELNYCTPTLDPCYPLEHAVRLCIMDPGFPQFVNEVEKIMDSISNTF